MHRKKISSRSGREFFCGEIPSDQYATAVASENTVRNKAPNRLVASNASEPLTRET